ncbi:MAG: ABC transporter permease [Lachnospiraceae bacterium]|nr:ABC transporter permease [Lachnospiraceae bacterium]
MFDLKLKEVWQYRDLIWLFTKRGFVVSYKQTILGPLWLFLNPLLTSVVYVILFGNIAKLSTDGIPQLLFYLSGNAIWTYFSGCLSGNASTFTGNARLFGKVYFPRLVIPFSNVLSSILRFGIQMILVLAVLVFYAAKGQVHPNWWAWLLLPVLLLWLGIMGMGIGLIVSSVTTKYRDLSVLVGFGLQLWMYATPVVYPLSVVHGSLRALLLLNPVTQVVELFRYAVLGIGNVSVWNILWSWAVAFAAVLSGIVIFHRIERTFMDTV